MSPKLFDRIVDLAVANDLELCRDLIAGHDLNEPADDEGYTVLMEISRRGLVDACKLLLQAGARADVRDYTARTALLGAAMEGHIRVCQLLLEHGADPNAAEEELGANAADVAISTGNIELLQLLKRFGAALDGYNLEYAALYGRGDIVDFVLENCAGEDLTDRMPRVLTHAASSGNENLVRRFLSMGIRIEPKAVANVAEQGNLSMFRLLLEHGADVHGADGPHGTALHAAAKSGAAGVVGALLDSGVKVHAYWAGRVGWTPIYSLVKYYGDSQSPDTDYAETLDRLVEHGADLAPSCTKAGDLTPFQFAVANGKTQLVQILVEKYGEDIAQRTFAGETMTQLASKHSATLAYLHARRAQMVIQDALAAGSSDAPHYPPPVRPRSGGVLAL